MTKRKYTLEYFVHSALYIKFNIPLDELMIFRYRVKEVYYLTIQLCCLQINGNKKDFSDILVLIFVILNDSCTVSCSTKCCFDVHAIHVSTRCNRYTV